MIEADFPKTLPEFLERFGREQDCRDYLARQKWPHGYRCRSCAGQRAHYLPSRKTFECAGKNLIQDNLVWPSMSCFSTTQAYQN